MTTTYMLYGKPIIVTDEGETDAYIVHPDVLKFIKDATTREYEHYVRITEMSNLVNAKYKPRTLLGRILGC